MRISLAMALAAAAFIFGGCAANQAQIEFYGVTEDRYPKIDVIPYEKEYQEKIEEVFSELENVTGKTTLRAKKSGDRDFMRYF